MTNTATYSDLPPPPPKWRRFVPAWLRTIIWLDDVSSYDAFLSYSWSADRGSAEIIHDVLQQFLRPWYKTRAKTIFRDLSCLPAGSSLNDELRDRLDRSTHLIVLACPEAARSSGMEFEAESWFAKDRRGDVLIVVTHGVYESWSDIRHQALPPTLRETLVKEPLWISLRHRQQTLSKGSMTQATRSELTEDLRQLILRLYPGRTWEELRGQERSQRISLIRILATTALVFLLISVLAIWQAATARREARLAQSRALAAQSELMVSEDQSQALNLAVQSWQTKDTPEAHLSLAHSFPSLLAITRGNVAAFALDSRRIVTGNADGTAWIWSAGDGLPLGTLTGHTGGIEQAAFSPDGEWVVTASDDRTAKVWKAATSGLVATLNGHGTEVYAASFSPDGSSIVTAGEDGGVLVWSAVDRRRLTTIKTDHGPIFRVQFSSDGQRLVTASEDGTAQVWNASDGRLVFTLTGHRDSVWDAAFSADASRIVTASADRSARIWNARDGRLLVELKGHVSAVYRALFIGDGGRIATAERDGMVRLFNMTGALLVAFQASGTNDPERRGVNRIAVSSDGKWIITATNDNAARIWSAASGKLLAVLRGHTKGVRHAEFSPDNRQIITAADDGTIRIWNTNAARVDLALGDGSRFCGFGTISSDGRRILIGRCNAGKPRIVSAVSGRQGAVLSGDSYSNATFSPDGTQVLTDDAVSDAETGRPMFRLVGHSSTVFHAEFSPDGRTIVTASRDATARVWDAHSGKLITILPHADRVNSAAFSPDSQSVVTAGGNRLAIVWNAVTGRQSTTMTGHTDSLRTATFSPDGKRIITGSYDRSAAVWRADTGERLTTLLGHGGTLNQALFSPNGDRILTVGDHEALLWNANDYRLLVRLNGRKGGGIKAAAFSRDGRRLLMTVLSSATNIYDAGTGRPITTIDGQHHGLMYSLISPDGRHVVTLNRDKTMFVHKLWSLEDLTRLIDE